MSRTDPPRSESELLARAQRLDGLTVGELARQLGRDVPTDPVRAKGRVGTLVELGLGASAGNLDQPDFQALGIELKTVPIDELGRVRESTFVCSLDLRGAAREEWQSSRVRRKLRCVLWVPVEAPGRSPLAERHLGTPRLWRPSPEEERILRADWTAIMGRIGLGAIEEISAHEGIALQLRPKARSGASRAAADGREGERLAVNPRGFYLRARFTEEILWRC